VSQDQSISEPSSILNSRNLDMLTASSEAMDLWKSPCVRCVSLRA